MNLPELALRWPRTTVALALATTLAALPGLWRLELQTDGNRLVPESDPAVLEDRALRNDFAVRDPLFVVLPAPSGVFDPQTLAHVVAVTRALEALPGVAPEDVLSLATVPGAGFEAGTFSPRPLLEAVPVSAAEARRVAQEAALLGLDEGPLIATDGRATIVLVGVPAHGDRRGFYRAARLAAERAAPGVELAVVGAPVAETLLGHHVLADLGLPVGELAADRAEAQPAARGFAPLAKRLRGGIGLLPLAVAVMALVLAVTLRRPAAVAIPLLKIGGVLTVLFGTLGWLGVPFTLVTAVLPVLLTAVGITDEIHLLRRLQEIGEDSSDEPGPDLVARALVELRSPLVQTSVTTAVGLLSFAVSPIPPIRLFGFQAAFGVGLCLLWALTVSPALLALAPRRTWLRERREENRERGLPRWLEIAGRPSAARSRRLAWAAAALALFSLGGLYRLEVQDSWVDGFDPESGFARVVRSFERNFRGLHRLLLAVEATPLDWTGMLDRGALGTAREVVLPWPPELTVPERLAGAELQLAASDAGTWRAWVDQAERRGASLVLRLARKGGSPWHGRPPAAGVPITYRLRLRPFLAPAVLARTHELENHLAAAPGVGRVLGPTAPLATAGRLFAFLSGPGDGAALPPTEPSRALSAWSALATGLGPARQRQLVEPEDYSRVLITVILHEARYAEVERLFEQLDRFAADRLAPLGIHLEKGGDVAVSQALIRAVVATQVGSLGLSLLGIFAVAAWLGGSLGWGLRVLAAPCLAVVLTFAAMGWAGITLGVATAMFTGMTLGVGVDATIHLLARHRLLATRYPDRAERARAALVSVLPAITIDTVTVGGGFGVLLLSSVPANSRLAGLVLLSLGACWLATVAVLPRLLAGRSRRGSP